MQTLNGRYCILAAMLACLIGPIACPEARAQAAPAPSSAPASSKVLITILDGEGALNDIRQRTAREPIVQVQDENHKPIAGAFVLFLLPDSGPGATFANGARMYSTLTDETGRAAAQAMRPNNISGDFQIRVRVTWNGSTTETTIQQKNVSQASSSSGEQGAQAAAVAHGLSLKTSLIIMGVVGAAAGTAIGIAVTRGNTTSITPGNPTVGAPGTAIVSFSLSRHAH